MRLNGMLGLGDNFYQRAVVRELGQVDLVTAWPQLYVDLPVRCFKPATKLRTQLKNVQRADLNWWTFPHGAPAGRRFHYDTRATILESLMRSVGLQRDTVNFDGPPVDPARGRYILVRPATVRREWMAASRNPLPEYLGAAAEALRRGFTIVSIADLDDGKEWAVEPLPFAHETFHRGELEIEDLLSLVAGASGVVGGVGWLLPAAIAYRVPMLLLYGGWGYLNGPQRVLDPRMDSSRVVQVVPDAFCMCNDRAHACNKTITGLEAHLERFVRLAEDRAPRLAA